ncbi:MAG TPA: hypothetical protein VFX05_11005, partial [Casimicrobiaceae bacterium]|nr:hypothetical protein [Casimicrobiaceae bacterium]
MIAGADAASDARSVLPARTRLHVRWPAVLETALAVIAIAALLPWFAQLAAVEGRQGRFEPAAVLPLALPTGVLAAQCAADGGRADAALRARLCPRPWPWFPRPQPVRLDIAHAAAVRAFEQPAAQARQRLAALRESMPDPATVAALDEGVRSFVARYALDGQRGPAPLACAAQLATASARDDARGANAALLLAATLEGHAAAPALARAAVLPDARMRAGPCADVAPRDALEQAAALVADARAARLHAAKSDAIRALLPAAGGQWAAAMLVTLVLVKLSRTRMRASVGCGLAMLA